MPPKPPSDNARQGVATPIANGYDGFRDVAGGIRPRLVVSVCGTEKSGKSHFALTAPGPIYYQNADQGTEGVIDKFIGKKPMKIADYQVWLPESVEQLEGNAYLDAVANICNPRWESFKRDFRSALSKGRTIIWDTADEFWELIRLARWGKVGEMKPHHYGPLNREYRDLINEAYSSDCSLIMLHKMKDEYINEKKTGKLKRTGFKDADYASQVAVRTFKEGGQFMLEIVYCRPNPDLEGFTMPNDFGELANLILPEFGQEAWK